MGHILANYGTTIDSMARNKYDVWKLGEYSKYAGDPFNIIFNVPAGTNNGVALRSTVASSLRISLGYSDTDDIVYQYQEVVFTQLT